MRDRRMEELEEYLSKLCERPDMRTNPVFRKFMGIDVRLAERSKIGEVRQLGGCLGLNAEPVSVMPCRERSVLFVCVN